MTTCRTRTGLLRHRCGATSPCAVHDPAAYATILAARDAQARADRKAATKARTDAHLENLIQQAILTDTTPIPVIRDTDPAPAAPHPSGGHTYTTTHHHDTFGHTHHTPTDHGTSSSSYDTGSSDCSGGSY